MATTTLLQFSDVHLGARFAWLPADRRLERRRDQQRALERAVQLAIERGVAAILLPDASVDLREALAAEPPAWIRGRVHLELGKIDDLGGRRSGALEHYKTAKSTCEASRDPKCADEAGRLIRRPFRFDKSGT